MKEYITFYDSPLGRITLASDGASLTGLWFEGQKYYAETLDPDHEEKDLEVFHTASRWLDCYFSGNEPDFIPPVVLKTTPFRKRVYEIMSQIPYGSTMTYGEIADIIARERKIPHMSAQAVGNAVGHNPISVIIPCHRVIASDGSLRGYAAGIEKKIALLKMEKAV